MVHLSSEHAHAHGVPVAHGDDLAARIRRAGYRLTRQRLAVLAAVEASPTGLSATELLAAARGRCAEVGLATVYRTLDILNAIGCAERVHVTSGGTAYVRCPSTQHHHVVCRTCGRVAHFQGCVVEEMVPAVAAQTGFTIESHILELQGVCRECRERGVDGGGRA